jgi:DNA invertase Pin-like site-specific DNA recombinase
MGSRRSAAMTSGIIGRPVESHFRDGGKALDHARLTGATLLIAKLDRLSRDGVSFVAADMPEANALTVGIMALVAQQECEAISRRTREALAAARARGVKLGCPNGAAHLRRYGNGLAVTALKAAVGARANGLAATIEAIKGEGVTSANGIAKALNKRSMATPRGGKWPARSVLNLTARLA